jgi:hypothetical protein
MALDIIKSDLTWVGDDQYGYTNHGASDGTYLYLTASSISVFKVYKLDLETLTLQATWDSPVNYADDDYASLYFCFHSGGFLYVLANPQLATAARARVYKINAETMTTVDYWEHDTGNAAEPCYGMQVDDTNIYLRFGGHAYRSYEYQFVKVDQATMTTKIYAGYTPDNITTLGGPYEIPLVDGKLYFWEGQTAAPDELWQVRFYDIVDAATMTLDRQVIPDTDFIGTSWSAAGFTSTHIYIRGGLTPDWRRMALGSSTVEIMEDYNAVMIVYDHPAGIIGGRYDYWVSLYDDTGNRLESEYVNMRVYYIIKDGSNYYLIGRTSTLYPTVHIVQIGYFGGKIVSSLVHRYDRKGRIYNLEINHGGVIADFGLPEWTTKPTDSIKNAEDEVVVEPTKAEDITKPQPEVVEPSSGGTDVWRTITPWREGAGETFWNYGLDDFVVDVYHGAQEVGELPGELGAAAGKQLRKSLGGLSKYLTPGSDRKPAKIDEDAVQRAFGNVPTDIVRRMFAEGKSMDEIQSYIRRMNQ